MNFELNNKLFKVIGFYPPQFDMVSSYFKGVGEHFMSKYNSDQILHGFTSWFAAER